MAIITFPEPEIHHCQGCGCQQWFYPEVYPAPEIILCWRCRGTVFSQSDDDDQQDEAQPAIPVQMKMFGD